MKRKTSHTVMLLLTGLFLAFALSACGGGGSSSSTTASSSATLSGSAQ